MLRSARRHTVFEQGIQARHLLVLDQLVTGDAQLATEVEQVVLDRHQFLAQDRRHLLAQQQADEGVELVDFTQGRDARAVLAGAAAVAQSGAAVVPGPCGDF
jgi:hypothetical protein